MNLNPVKSKKIKHKLSSNLSTITQIKNQRLALMSDVLNNNNFNKQAASPKDNNMIPINQKQYSDNQ